MKTHVLTVSRVFPTTHKRKGERTKFVCKILHTINHNGGSDLFDRCGHECNVSCERRLLDPKLHTVRANYEYWRKRILEVRDGEAILSVRYWSGKPYNSKQRTICNLTSDDGIGIQKIWGNGNNTWSIDNAELPYYGSIDICRNDGLSFDDFNDWFRKYDLSEPMALIHFTDFRYSHS